MSFNQNFSFYLRVILCTFFIASWTLWLTNIPRKSIKKSHKHLYVSRIKKDKRRVSKAKQSKFPEQRSEQKLEHKEKQKNETKIILKIAKQSHDISQNEIAEPVPSITRDLLTMTKKGIELKEKINLPKVASATRTALLTMSGEKNPQTEGEINKSKLALRKEIRIDKNKLKPIILKQNLEQKQITQEENNEIQNDTWLPKYPENEQHSTNNQNSDQIIQQIELSGIVNKPNGEITAIIKNKTNNYIEFLKRGDQYKGLKLLEINKRGIIFENITTNKKYSKKIIIGN